MVRTDHAETAEWSVENAKCKMVKSPISAQLVHVDTVIGLGKCKFNWLLSQTLINQNSLLKYKTSIYFLRGGFLHQHNM